MQTITRAEARKRLLMIARKTESVPPDRFNFARYVDDDWQGKPDLSCNTRACAIGYGTTIPYLRKLGLHLVFMGVGESGYPTVGDAGMYGSNRKVAKLLGITEDEYEYVFIPNGGSEQAISDLGSEVTDQQVADHIRHFVDWRF